MSVSSSATTAAPVTNNLSTMTYSRNSSAVPPSVDVGPELADHRYAFTCLVCLEQFIGPIELDCRHIFCESCLRTHDSIFQVMEADGGNSLTSVGSDANVSRIRCPTCCQMTTSSGLPSSVSEFTSGTMSSSTLADHRSSLLRKVPRVMFEQFLKCDCCVAISVSVSTLGHSESFEAISTNDGNLSFTKGQTSLKNGSISSQVTATNSETAAMVTRGVQRRPSTDILANHGRGPSLCNPSIEDADFHCAKCELNLCRTCRTRHDLQPLFKGHAVVNVTNREAVQLYCPLHSTANSGRRRVCLFYCSDCDRLMCVLCVLHDDPQHRPVKLHDALAERRDALKTLLNTLGPRLNRLGARATQLKQMYSDRRQGRFSVTSGSFPPTPRESLTEPEFLQQIRPFFSSIGGTFRRSRSRSRTSKNKYVADFTTSLIDTAVISTSAVGQRHLSQQQQQQQQQARQSAELAITPLQQMQSATGADPEEEDCGSVGTDSETNSMNNEGDSFANVYPSRRQSAQLEECSALLRAPIPADDSSEHSSLVSFTTIIKYVDKLKKLYEKSTKVLEISDSKKLLAVYNEVSARLKTVVESELPLIQRHIDNRMVNETNRQARPIKSVNGATPNNCSQSPSSLTPSTESPLTDGENSDSSLTSKLQLPYHQQQTHHNQPQINTENVNSGGTGRFTKILSKTIMKSSSSELLSSMAPTTTTASDACRSSADTSLSNLVGPMSLLVRPKLLWKVEKQRTDIGEMCNPSDVAFLVDETALVVAEYDSVNERNNKLQLFDRGTGRLMGALGQGQIQPLGVTVTRDGQNLVVTDCRGKRVRMLSLPTGQTVVDIGKGQFGWPYGIAVTSHGQIVVTDAFNDTVSIFSPDGKKLKTIGGQSGSSSSTTFRNPYHVTVDDRDIILVSDFGNNAVKAFDLSGRHIFSASEMMQPRGSVDLMGGLVSGTPSGSRQQASNKRRRLRGPRGIAVEYRQRHVIVADDRSRVCLFSPGGQYVRNLLSEEDSVKYPEALECSRSGLLAVTEWNQNNAFAVKLFNLYE